MRYEDESTCEFSEETKENVSQRFKYPGCRDTPSQSDVAIPPLLITVCSLCLDLACYTWPNVEFCFVFNTTLIINWIFIIIFLLWAIVTCCSGFKYPQKLVSSCYICPVALRSPGCNDTSQASWNHGPHPRPGGPPDLPSAGERLHPDVALPAVPPLPALRPPHGTHVRGLPGSLLPEVGFQGSGPQRGHSGAPQVHWDVLLSQGPRLHASQQWMLKANSPDVDSCRPYSEVEPLWHR